MAEERVERRLAAVLAADVAGYSRLMGDDEAKTRARFNAQLDQDVKPAIDRHRGRLVKTMGDGFLIEFRSVIDAVQCAVDIQNAVATQQDLEPDKQRMMLRMGVHLGDVIVEGDDIHGDGVNIAARLEGLAEPGSVCVSDMVHAGVGNKLDLDFADLGEQALKNIVEPVRVYRVMLETASENSATTDRLFRRPAVAVLPFENLSGDADQEYFADGLTEDVITALSLWRSFPVIARNSTFAYKGKSPDIRQVGKELGARYVIEGSVRKSGESVRVSAQLIDTQTGHHVWTERFDRKLEDIFALQDEITRRIAASVSPELERHESLERAKVQPQNLDAWDYVQRGMARFYRFTDEENKAAREMFEMALEIDPEYARAFAAIGYSHAVDLTQYLVPTRDESVAALWRAAQQAVKLDPSDSFAQVILSFGYAWTDQQDLSIAAGEKAIELNPSNTLAYAHLGTVLDLVGRHEEGIARLEQSFRINPHEPLGSHVHLAFHARALYTLRRYDEAVASARKAITLRAGYPPAQYLLAISLGQLGRTAEARAELDAIAREHPGFIEKRGAWRPYRDQAENDHLFDGLRKAGWES